MSLKVWLKKVGEALWPLDRLAEEDLSKLPKGAEYLCEVTQPRNPKFHRKYMALMRVAFDAWEGFDGLEWKGVAAEKDFDTFRNDITVLCGPYTPTYHANGSLSLKPKSISFASMDETEFEELYNKAIDVILRTVLRHYTREDLARVVDRVLGFS